MAEKITTRQALRRNIGAVTRQESYLRFANLNGVLPITDPVGSTNTTTIIRSSDHLLQDTDHWKGKWAYVVTDSEERPIVGSSSDGELLLDYPLSAAPTSDDELEIWGTWPPSLIHLAINRAIREGNDFWPNIVTAETMIVQEDKLVYGLAASDFNQQSEDDYPNPKGILSVWLERSDNVKRGQVTAEVISTAIYALDDTDTEPDTTASSDWLVSIYAGTGRGQLRQVTSWSSDGRIAWDTAMAPGPDTTSFYAIWKVGAGEETTDWYPMTGLRFDSPDNPDLMYLTQTYPAAEGLRFRIKYEAQSSDLAADSDETRVPEDYILFKSLAYLYTSLLADSRLDRSENAGLVETYENLARTYIADHRANLPSRQVWTEEDHTAYGAGSGIDNPMGW